MSQSVTASSVQAIVRTADVPGSRPGSQASSPTSSLPGTGKNTPVEDKGRSRSPSPPPSLPTLATRPADEKVGGGTKLLNKLVGKYNDSHMHYRNYRQVGKGLVEYVRYMDVNGIRYSTLMAIPTSVKAPNSTTPLVEEIGVCGCSPDYYLEQYMLKQKSISKKDIGVCTDRAMLSPDTEVDDDLAFSYKRLGETDRARFDPMITGLDIGNADCCNKLLAKLRRNRGVFTGVGEITIHKEVVDKLIGKGWAHLKKNINPLIQLLYTCGRIKMPVVLHCDIGRHDARPHDVPKYLQGLKDLFSHKYVKDTTIIWAHAGGLGRFVNAPDNHVETLRGMLESEECPKLYIDLSWTVVADKLTVDECTTEKWRALIEEFPDRFIFGSDTLAPKTAQSWNATYEKYEGLRNALKETTTRQVFFKNYERLFVEARPGIRHYENTRLDADIEDLELRMEELALEATTMADSSTSSTSTTTASSSTPATSSEPPASDHVTADSANIQQPAYS